MVKEIIEVPEGIEFKIKNNSIIIKGREGSVEKIFRKDIKASGEGKKIILEKSGESKRERKLVLSLKSHLENVIEGVQKRFVYKLQICYVHFPMNVSIDKNNHELIIKNFLGEKKDRKAKILPNTDAKIEGDIIYVESPDIEAAGQTAANMETSTRIKARDRRIFQDGIWITEKPGEAKE